MAPLRVLCVHGYRQSGASFREKTGALRKLLKTKVHLVYVDAPHLLGELNINSLQSLAGLLSHSSEVVVKYYGIA